MSTASIRPGETGYRALAHDLRTRIVHGEYAEGQALPTEMTLAAQTGLSRQTVRRAFQALVAEGLVYRVRGKGTFVKPRDPRYRRVMESVGDLMDLQLDTDSELIRALGPTLDPVAAEALGCPGGTVHSLAFLRSHSGRVFSRTIVHVPPRVAGTLSGIEELTTLGLRSRYTVIGLIERRGTDVDDAEQAITARLADAQLAADLGCEAGVPLLHVERTYFDTRGGAVEYEVTDLLPELYSHQSRLRRRRAHQS